MPTDDAQRPAGGGPVAFVLGGGRAFVNEVEAQHERGIPEATAEGFLHDASGHPGAARGR